VWGLFLLFIHETIKQTIEQASPNATVPDSLKAAWYASCDALIRAGAGPNRKRDFVTSYDGAVLSIFRLFCTKDQDRRLYVQMEAVASRRKDEELQKNSGNDFVALWTISARVILVS
jgi:hypothetical protein